MEKISEPDLKNGISYRFADQYETIESSVIYARILDGTCAFKISINDRPVFISKTFEPTVHELNKLIDKYKLKALKFKDRDEY